MSIQDANHWAVTTFFAGMTAVSDNIFEIIGAVGVIVNLAFVAKSFLSKKKVDALDTENKLLEQELLKKQIEAINEAAL